MFKKPDLNPALGIIGSLHDVFNRLARDCEVVEVQPLFEDMARRFDRLAAQALGGNFGTGAGASPALQEALDRVFEPMRRLHDLSCNKPSLRMIWDEANDVITSYETPVTEALKKCNAVAPDKVELMKPLRFRLRMQPLPA